MSFVGIDIGTSGTELLLVSEDGTLQAKTTVEYGCSSPHPMWSEQNPEDWWAAVCTGLRQVLHKAGGNAGVKTVSFSGRMAGLVTRDDQGSYATMA